MECCGTVTCSLLTCAQCRSAAERFRCEWLAEYSVELVATARMKVKLKTGDLVYVDYAMIDANGESLGLRAWLGEVVSVRKRWIKVDCYDEAGELPGEAVWFRPNKVRLAADVAATTIMSVSL